MRSSHNPALDLPTATSFNWKCYNGFSVLFAACFITIYLYLINKRWYFGRKNDRHARTHIGQNKNKTHPTTIVSAFTSTHTHTINTGAVYIAWWNDVIVIVVNFVNFSGGVFSPGSRILLHSFLATWQQCGMWTPWNCRTWAIQTRQYHVIIHRKCA